ASDGLGIILIASEWPEVLTVSDRILVMRLGRLVAELDVQGTTQETILEYALGERQPEEGRKAL
ncbi:MAG: D-xylose ABC transporter ATP-binding protein, partial [Novibacillus thermophilus]